MLLGQLRAAREESGEEVDDGACREAEVQRSESEAEAAELRSLLAAAEEQLAAVLAAQPRSLSLSAARRQRPPPPPDEQRQRQRQEEQEQQLQYLDEDEADATRQLRAQACACASWRATALETACRVRTAAELAISISSARPQGAAADEAVEMAHEASVNHPHHP